MTKKAQNKEWISLDAMRKLDVRKERKKELNTSRTRTAKPKLKRTTTRYQIEKLKKI